MLTVKEAAAQLRVHPMTVRKMITDGRIPAVQLGGPGTSIRIDPAELDAWLYADVGGSFTSSQPPATPAERRVPGDPAVEAWALARNGESR
jgi:excisionase family DNA binding protein